MTVTDTWPPFFGLRISGKASGLHVSMSSTGTDSGIHYRMLLSPRASHPKCGCEGQGTPLRKVDKRRKDECEAEVAGRVHPTQPC